MIRVTRVKPEAPDYLIRLTVNETNWLVCQLEQTAKKIGRRTEDTKIAYELAQAIKNARTAAESQGGYT